MDQGILLLLKKYLNNQCDASDLARVKELLERGTHEQEWLAAMQDDLLAEQTANNTIFAQNKVFNRIRRTTGLRRPSQRYGWISGVAAALLIFSMAGYLVLQRQSAVATKFAVINTGTAKLKVITLDDGTRVTLNSESQLRYQPSMDGNKREVYLSGEAFFEVKHDASRPFIVHAGKLHVQVLGTSFDVKAYQTEMYATVGVASGKVGVYDVGKAQLLLPGNQLTYQKNNGVYTKVNIGIDEITGWQNGMLIFRQQSLDEIAHALQRSFGINVIIRNKSLAAKRVTASFNKKSLTQVLNILSKTAGFAYTSTNQQVIIY